MSLVTRPTNPILTGPHLVLRFDQEGAKEIPALSFALDSTELKVADEWGGWHTLLRFDLNRKRWLYEGQPVSRARVETSDGGDVSLSFHPTLAALDRNLGARSLEAIVLLGAQRQGTPNVRLRRPQHGTRGSELAAHFDLNWDPVGCSSRPLWRAQGAGSIGVSGTLLLSTPGRELHRKPAKLVAHPLTRPSALAERLLAA